MNSDQNRKGYSPSRGNDGVAGQERVPEGLRIVIVEDDVLIAMDLADLLVGLGHDVCATARTQGEAVTAAEKLQPDLMIVDGNLEDGSGVSAMRKILAHRFVPHFYVTGDPLQLQGLANDTIVVAKPFNLRSLSNGITRALTPAIGNLSPPMKSSEQPR